MHPCYAATCQFDAVHLHAIQMQANLLDVEGTLCTHAVTDALLCLLQPCIVHPEARIVVHTPARLLHTLQAPFLDRYACIVPLPL